MTSMDPNLLNVIACPQCHGSLHYTKENVLVCLPCRLCFPVEEGIPQLKIHKARSLSASNQSLAVRDRVLFVITEGVDEGGHFHLEQGTCLAIGRPLEDMNATMVLDRGHVLSLDEPAKRLIGNYLEKASKKIGGFKKTDTHEELGGFKRLGDLILRDPLISRLHAMVFFDENEVGVLDLVSRNGTFVNGEEVEAKLLEDGDVIMLGRTLIRVNFK